MNKKILSYPNQSKMIEQKIKKLFNYRKLPYLLSFLSKKEAKSLNKKLVALQIAIYDLDGYLEANWELSKTELKRYWKKIYAALYSMGLDSSEAYNMTNHIRRYQRHEQQLRDGIMPTRFNKEFYYYYKSCDVRLMREIIYNINPSIEQECSLDDWRYFDVITEVNDDVEDVFEDQKTINGNVFLIQLLQEGLDATENAFNLFLKEMLEKEHKRHNSSFSKNTSMLYDATLSEAIMTLDLLSANISKLRKKSAKGQFPSAVYNIPALT